MTQELDWTQRGRELGATLDTAHSIVVVGTDATDASEVALGIARVQALRRRVAVGDLFGEAPPLQALLTSDDPHGIVDSFTFGVSLNRIAHAVADAGELFIMPSGSSPLEYEELFANPRWRRLSSGFREVGALLVLVAPADSANLADLVFATDGAVIVGDTVPAEIPVAQTVAWLRPRRARPTTGTGAPLAMVEASRAKPRGHDHRILAGAAGLALALAAVAGFAWFAARPYAAVRRDRVAGTATSPVVAGHLVADSVAAARADSIRRDSIAAAGTVIAVVDSFPVLQPVNSGDAARASAWAVRLEQTNTPAGAILDLRGRFENVPAGTYGLDLRTRVFLLVGGASPTRVGAESLLVRLRTQKVLGAGTGSVVSLPYAFLVQADVPAADVPARLARFAARGQPVYALRQASGTANFYFGAYESPQHAALAVPSVREAELTPTLAYRTGRVF